MKSNSHLPLILGLLFTALLALGLTAYGLSGIQQAPQMEVKEKNGNQQDQKGKPRPTEKNIHATVTRRQPPLVKNGKVAKSITIRSHEVYTLSYNIESTNTTVDVTYAPFPGAVTPAVGSFELDDKYFMPNPSIHHGVLCAHVDDLVEMIPDDGTDRQPMYCTVLNAVRVDALGCGTVFAVASGDFYDSVFLISGSSVKAWVTSDSAKHEEEITKDEAAFKFLRGRYGTSIEKLDIASDPEAKDTLEYIRSICGEE